jgi:hypothetical protein
MRPSIVPAPLQRLLRLEMVDRTRRNHGLEHATLTLLARRIPGLVAAGRSTPNGFYLYGNLNAEAVAEAAQEALNRMRAGEAHLAVHPNCGTNFVTAGMAAGLAAFVGFLGANSRRARWERLPIVVGLCSLALIASHPLGLVIQRDITTSGDMRDLQITHITRSTRGRLTIHFVATAG